MSLFRSLRLALVQHERLLVGVLAAVLELAFGAHAASNDWPGRTRVNSTGFHASSQAPSAPRRMPVTGTTFPTA